MPNPTDPNQNLPVDQPSGPPTGSTVQPINSIQTDSPPPPPAFQSVTPDSPPASPVNQAVNPLSSSTAPPDLSSVVSSKPKKKFGTGGVIATILGILVLVGGAGTGVYLTQQKQNIFSLAWKSKADVARQDKIPLKDVTADMQKRDSTKEKDKPDIPTLPPSTPTPPSITAQCLGVKAYNNPARTVLTPAQLSALKSGAVVNFCVAGSASSGTFDKAQFKINSTLKPVTTSKRPGSNNEYCQSYTILPTDTTINVQAKIHHVTLGWEGDSI